MHHAKGQDSPSDHTEKFEVITGDPRGASRTP